jgi:hypothetical protein
MFGANSILGFALVAIFLKLNAQEKKEKSNERTIDLLHKPRAKFG